jgi:hypothetical protein
MPVDKIREAREKNFLLLLPSSSSFFLLLLLLLLPELLNSFFQSLPR